MKLFTINCAVIIMMSLALQAGAEQLPPEAQRMLDDLGSPVVQRNNNGKTFNCRYGGTKSVTVEPLADATLISGDYSNCREAGSVRDGYFEFIIRDWMIVGESSRRSINGELQDAVQRGDLKKAVALVRKKADVNYAERIELTDGGFIDGWTPLMSAAMTGNLKMTRLMLKSGAWVNYLNSRANNALSLAVSNGNLDVVRLLVANGGYLNNSNYEDVTPLMTAAINGDYKVAKFLVGKKADLNLVHKDGDSALMFALANRRTDIARLLVESGAKLNIQNKYGVTALIIAAAEGNEEIARLLVQRKADLTAKTGDGQTARDIALAKGYTKIAELLKY